MEKTVLSVDDEVEARVFVSTVLEENGYKVIEATNGEEAIEVIKQKKPDLVIMDMLMPKQSGLILYRELKTSDSFKDIPVIVYSGIPRRTLLRAQVGLAESSGEQRVPDPEAYIEKPVAPDHLAAAIRKVLGQ